jgi:hypothetical protein
LEFYARALNIKHYTTFKFLQISNWENEMFKSWFNLSMLAAESQQVVWLRTMKLARGGVAAKREAKLMVSEKVAVANSEAGRMMMGATPVSVIKRYRRKVKANMRRLSK